jgi:hypothetical protein
MGMRGQAGSTEVQQRARALVRFWHERRWLSAPSPLHVHPLDLAKLEQLIADAISDPESVKLPPAP